MYNGIYGIYNVNKHGSSGNVFMVSGLRVIFVECSHSPINLKLKSSLRNRHYSDAVLFYKFTIPIPNLNKEITLRPA